MGDVFASIDVGERGFSAKVRVRRADDFHRFATAVFDKVGQRRGHLAFSSPDGRVRVLDKDSFSDDVASGFPRVRFYAPDESGRPGPGGSFSVNEFQTFEEMRNFYQGRGLAVKMNKWKTTQKYYKLRCTFKLESGNLCQGSGRAYYDGAENTFVVRINDDHGEHSKWYTSKARLHDEVRDFIVDQMSFGLSPTSICTQAREKWPHLIGKIDPRTCTNVYYAHQTKSKKSLAGTPQEGRKGRTETYFREFCRWAAAEFEKFHAADFLDGPADDVRVIYANNVSRENFCTIMASPNMIRNVSAAGAVCVDGKQGINREGHPAISVLVEGANHEAHVVFVGVCSREEDYKIWQQIAECLARWGREIHGSEWSVRCLLADQAPVIDKGFQEAGFDAYARGSCLFHVIRNCDEHLVNGGIGKEQRVATLTDIRTIATCAQEKQFLLTAEAYVKHWGTQGEAMKTFAAYFSKWLLGPTRRGWYAGALPIGTHAANVTCEGINSYYKRAYASQRLGLVSCCRALQGRILPGFSIGFRAKSEIKTKISYKIQEIASGIGESMLIAGDVGYAWSAQGASFAKRPFFTPADLVAYRELAQKGQLTKEEAGRLLNVRRITAERCSCSHFCKDGYCSHHLAFLRKVGMSLPENIMFANPRGAAAAPARAKLSAAERRELQNVQKSHICGICNRWCGNSANLKSHEAGKSHRDVLARMASSLPNNARAPRNFGFERYGGPSDPGGRLGHNIDEEAQGIQAIPGEGAQRAQNQKKRPRQGVGMQAPPRPIARKPARVDVEPPKRLVASLRNAEYLPGRWLTGVEIVLAESVFANHGSFKSAVPKNYFTRQMASAMARRTAANEVTHWGGVWIVNSARGGSPGSHWAAAHAVWNEFGHVVVNVVDSLSGERFGDLIAELNERPDTVAGVHGLDSQDDAWSCGYWALYVALQMSERASRGAVFDIRELEPMPGRFVHDCNAVLSTLKTHGSCPRRQWR